MLPMEPPNAWEEEKDEVNPPFPKPVNDPNPPILPNPPIEPKKSALFFVLPPRLLREKNLLMKSASSSLSNMLLEKKCLKRSSASSEVNWQLKRSLLLYPFGPSCPQRSQLLRFSASERYQQAQAISLNILTASSLLSGFLSGCHLMANFLQAFFMSASVACLVSPNTSQQSRLDICKINYWSMSKYMTQNKQILTRELLDREIFHSPTPLQSQASHTRPKRTYTSADHYDRQNHQFKLPQIKTIRYIVKKKADSPIRKDKLMFNFMSPTANSLISSKKQIQCQCDNHKKLCSVDCIDPKSFSSKPLLRLKQRSSRKKNHYYPTLRNYLYPEVSQSLDDPEIIPEGYEHIQSKRLNFFNLKSQFARQVEQPSYGEESVPILKQELIPTIPTRGRLSQFIRNYSSKHESIRMSRLLDSPNFAVQYAQNELFFGEVEHGQRHGLGILIDENKAFEGHFKRGQKQKGVETNQSGIYKGDYYQNRREGNGEFEWFNGEYYIGQWKNGKRHGNGMWLNSQGDSYNGSWKNGKGSGFGVYIIKNQKYKGEFQDFKKHGWGKEIFTNGDTYEGNYREGFPDGTGKYRWADGTIYEGEFKAGLRHGGGALRTPFNLFYQGEFFQERPEGICEIEMPNGDVYRGMFKDGRKNGRGILTIDRTKRILDGYWEDDRFVDSVVY